VALDCFCFLAALKTEQHSTGKNPIRSFKSLLFLSPVFENSNAIAEGEEASVAQSHRLSHAPFVARSFGAQNLQTDAATHWFAPQDEKMAKVAKKRLNALVQLCTQALKNGTTH